MCVFSPARGTKDPQEPSDEQDALPPRWYRPAIYDAYTHGRMTRRDFLDRAAQLTGGSAAAMAVLPFFPNDYRRQVVPPDHPDLKIS